jgi:hypothetical protein
MLKKLSELSRQACGEQRMRTTQVAEWLYKFRSSVTSVKVPSTRDVAVCSPVACYQFLEEHGASTFRLEKTAVIPFLYI